MISADSISYLYVLDVACISAANPRKCDEFSDPPTFSLCSSVLNPELILNGIPAILAFYHGTKDTAYVPDDSVLGGNKNEVAKFFQRCINYVS